MRKIAVKKRTAEKEKKKEGLRAEQVFRRDGKIRGKEEERRGKDTKNRRKRCDGCVR